MNLSQGIWKESTVAGDERDKQQQQGTGVDVAETSESTFDGQPEGLPEYPCCVCRGRDARIARQAALQLLDSELYGRKAEGDGAKKL